MKHHHVALAEDNWSHALVCIEQPGLSSALGRTGLLTPVREPAVVLLSRL